MKPKKANETAPEADSKKEPALTDNNKGSVADIDVLHEHANKEKKPAELLSPQLVAVTPDSEPEIHVTENPDNPTILDVVEGEVKQYVENGFVKGAWSDEDEEFLRKNYPTEGRKYCATHLNRNESSVQKKINSLGLKKKKKKKK